MTLWTIQVSNHPLATVKPVSEVAGKSWKILYDGTLSGGAKEARHVAKQLGHFYGHVQVFRGNNTLGKLWLEI